MTGTLLLNGSLGESLINFRGPLIRELVERGYCVHATAPDISADLRARLAELGAEGHEIPLSRSGLQPLGDLVYCLRLYRLIRRIGAGFVLGYTIKPNIWGSLAARLAGVRSASMVTGLGLAFTDGKSGGGRWVQRLAHRLYGFATRFNEHVVFQNRDDPPDFVRAGCLADPGKAVVVNGSGVDTAYFGTTPLPPEPRFLLIARLLRAKGILQYAEAARLVRASCPDARFRLVGPVDDGPDAVSPAELERAKAAGLEYLGAMEDVRPAISGCSVYVLPSYYREGTPRSILEAMAMGRPIITTDAPGCRETVSPGINGCLVRPGDSVSLAEAMVTLASSPDLRASMGAESRRIAVEKYAVGRVNQVLLAGLGL